MKLMCVVRGEELEFNGTVEYCHSSRMFFGRLRSGNGIFAYEGRTLSDLSEDFKEACDELVKDLSRER